MTKLTEKLIVTIATCIFTGLLVATSTVQTVNAECKIKCLPQQLMKVEHNWLTPFTCICHSLHTSEGKKNPSKLKVTIMTHEEINRLVAIHVMRWKIQTIAHSNYWFEQNGSHTLSSDESDQIDYFWPTGTVSTAFEVVDKLREEGWFLCLDEAVGITGEDFEAMFEHKDDPEANRHLAEASTRELAICKAALLVRGIEVDEETSP